MNNNGKYGEWLFSYKMKKQGYTVQDVSKEQNYWYKDIDFIIQSPFTGETKTFEVKWDTRIADTGNLYLELTNKNSKGGIGWWNFCQADYLVYGDARRQEFIIIELQKLRERVAPLKLRIASCDNDSTGYLINRKQIEDISSLLI